MNLLDYLPESLKTIVELTNVQTVMTLVDTYGGTTLHFPPLRLLNEKHDLALLLGLEQARNLCRYYAGGYIYLPRASHYMQTIRDEQIRAEAATLSVPELALKYKMSERWIRKIKSRALSTSQHDNQQISLF